jgi:hypothetical protein
MLKNIIAVSKATESLMHAIQDEQHSNRRTPECELEFILRAEAVDFLLAQLSQLNQPLMNAASRSKQRSKRNLGSKA